MGGGEEVGFAFSFTAQRGRRRKEADSAQQKEETEEKIGKEDAAAMSVLPPPPAVDRGEALLCVSSSSRAPPLDLKWGKEKSRESGVVAVGPPQKLRVLKGTEEKMPANLVR